MRPRDVCLGQVSREVGLRLLYFAMLMALSMLPAAAQECSPGSMVYRIDPDNITGLRHPTHTGEEIIETVRFEDDGFALVITTPQGERRYDIVRGGTGVRSQVAVPVDGSIDDGLWYQRYDISSRTGEGPASRFLMIEGDLYWPDC